MSLYDTQLELPNIPKPKADPITTPAHYCQSKIQPLELLKIGVGRKSPAIFLQESNTKIFA